MVFGNVMSGFEVLKQLEAHGDWRGNVHADVRVSKSGELRLSDAAREALEAQEDDAE